MCAQETTERGKFLLYKYQQKLGAESYEIKPEDKALTLQTNFELSFIGGNVPLSTTLKVGKDNYTPISFQSKGKTSTRTTVDFGVEIADGTATVRNGANTESKKAPLKFFTIAHPAPIAPLMMLFRYWQKNNVKTALPLFPGGTAKIYSLGQDQITVAGKMETMSRYCIEGVMWGCEIAWFDSNQNLIALVGADAEMDRFEAVREGYELMLPFFVSKATDEAIKWLEKLNQQIKPVQQGRFAIVGALLIDGNGGEPIKNSVVLVDNGQIIAVGKQGEVKIPVGFRPVNARGKTLLPGLWDTHAHATQPEWFPVSLAAGITTMRDAANEFEFILPIRNAIRDDRIKIAPQLLLAGYIDSTANTLGKMKAETPYEALRIVNEYKRAGFEQIKIYGSLRPELIKVVTDEAHRLGMTVTGHVPRGLNIYNAVENGFDQVNHLGFTYRAMLPKNFSSQPGTRPNIEPESDAAKEGLAFLAEHKTVIDPTLARGELNSYVRLQPFSSVEPGIEKAPYEVRTLIDTMGFEGSEEAEVRNKQARELSFRVIKALRKNGIPLIVGTDLAVPGHTEFREIELLVMAGLTPMEAIQAATIVPARVLKQDKEAGTIETGKRADMILIDGNPLESISNVRNVKFVVTKGRMYSTSALWQSVGFKP